MLRRSLIALALLLAPALAQADWRGRLDYPYFIADRPLTLPRYTAQVTGEVGLTHVENGDLGIAVGFGIDVAVHRRLQLGTFVAAPVHPGPDFGRFDFNLQIALARGFNLRFDLGGVRDSAWNGTSYTLREDGFMAGFSLPWRGRLHRVVSLYGWSADARAAGTHPVFTSGGARYSGRGLFPDMLFMFSVHDVSSGGALFYGSLYLPIGIKVQPVSLISFGARIGYRLAFSSDLNTLYFAHYIPLDLDLAFHLGRLVDLGFTATFQGPVRVENAIIVGNDWDDLRQFAFWVAGRF